MADATGNRIGFMRSARANRPGRQVQAATRGLSESARMGVFQITPVSSVDVSDWGENDTTSLEKKVMAVVRADFGMAQHS
jgi:hypothetical protein